MKTITIRLTDEEYKELKEISEKTGIPMTTLYKQGFELRKSQLS